MGLSGSQQCVPGIAGEVLAILFFNLDDEQLAYLQTRPGYTPNQDLDTVLDHYAALPQSAYSLLDTVSPALQVSTRWQGMSAAWMAPESMSCCTLLLWVHHPASNIFKASVELIMSTWSCSYYTVIASRLPQYDLHVVHPSHLASFNCSYLEQLIQSMCLLQKGDTAVSILIHFACCSQSKPV